MANKIDYEKELNAAQLDAVYSTDGPYLVIAGAGSGKTRVLVYRVAHLVEKGVSPQEVLLRTFTRKASEEMLRRAAIILDERCQRVSGGTFHSFANMALRKYASLLGFSNSFTILDRSDSEDALNLIRANLGCNKLAKRFPRKGALADIISKSINKAEIIESIIYDEYPQFIEWSQEIEKIKNEFAGYKRAKSLMDYDDLLVFFKELLVKYDDVRVRLGRKYKYIMVDEYQDTNKLQAFIVCLLASEHKNIMVVGDDSQSIYSFRGANFKNIIDFPKIFEGTKIIKLEENYRSIQPILNLTNEIISHSKESFQKNLFTKKPGENLPVYMEVRDEHQQSEFVADKILELREEGVELGDIAVLFRSGWHSNDLEIELANRNIPFVKYGGQKFVEAAHIKDVLSYLRIAYNLFDEVSWYRALLLIPTIGPKTVEKILSEIINNKRLPLSTDKLIQKSQGLKDLIGLLGKIDATRNTPLEIMGVFLKYYQPLLKGKYDDFNKRLNDLDSLERISGRYSSLEQFLTDLALEPPERNIVEAGSRDKDDSRLVLSTIHSAKGLEWHTVFLIYTAEGYLPSYLSLEDNEAIEEERRLFYVATTRAKDNLFLLKPRIDRSPRSYFSDGGTVFTQVSRFLEEGNILDRFVDKKQLSAVSFDDIGFDDVIDDMAQDKKESFEAIKDYFRDT